MSSAPTVPAEAAESEQKFSFGQRLKIWLVSWAGYLAIRCICPTLRYSVSIEDGGPESFHIAPAIYAFWHRCVFHGTYYYRNRNIAVMTSRSFDGEYIARIIEKLGYRVVRGSSSRGGARALLEMHALVERGGTVAFTADGPRGPRYVAKPGPVLLARNTGAPIMAFHLAVDRAWVLNSWDGFMIPKPFARVVLRIGKVIRVREDANDVTMTAAQSELQTTLDRVRHESERLVADQ